MRSKPLAAGAVVAALWGAGCSTIFGFEDAPPASECVSDADCPRGKICVAYACVPDCSDGGCSEDARREGAADVSLVDAADADVDVSIRPDASGDGASDERGADADADAAPGADVGIDREGGGPSDAEPDADADAEVDARDADAAEERDARDEDACGPLGCFRCYSPEEPDAGGLFCEAVCSRTLGCIVPPSCNGLDSSCGPHRSCCYAPNLPGGAFSRSSDVTCATECGASCPATVSAFTLDAFEVTVGRFRRFVAAYSKPAVGSGKNPKNLADKGWLASWDALLPADAKALADALASPGRAGPMTWTADAGPNETKPMNFVTWYMAYAFCVWDGGRLPTEAEWNYVAAGGAEGRRYPWSQPPESTTIDDTMAIYQSVRNPAAAPASVASAPAGRGRWGHYDLVGNVAEWTRDSWQDCYPTPSRCDDCANTAADPGPKILRGSSFTDSADDLVVDFRYVYAEDVEPWSQFGFRCARNP